MISSGLFGRRELAAGFLSLLCCPCVLRSLDQLKARAESNRESIQTGSKVADRRRVTSATKLAPAAMPRSTSLTNAHPWLTPADPPSMLLRPAEFTHKESGVHYRIYAERMGACVAKLRPARRSGSSGKARIALLHRLRTPWPKLSVSRPTDSSSSLP